MLGQVAHQRMLALVEALAKMPDAIEQVADVTAARMAAGGRFM